MLVHIHHTVTCFSIIYVSCNIPQTYGINSAIIVSKDNDVSNGIVHVIDEVLWPPEDLLMDKVQDDPQLQ